MTSLLAYFFMALAVSFLCSLLEAVLLSITPAHVAVLKKEGASYAARIEQLKERLNRSLASILTLNTIANTLGAAGVGASAHALAEQRSIDPPMLVAISSATLTLFILVFSEIIPKTVGAVYWKRLVRFASYVLPVLIRITLPFVVTLEAVSRSISSRGIEAVTLTREEILVTAELGADQGTLQPRETRIIRNLLLLGKLYVKDIMTPRSVMVSYQRDTTVAEVVGHSEQLRFSRLPTYGENHDDVKGIVHRYRIFQDYAAGHGDRPLRELETPVVCVPEFMTVARLFDEFIRRHQQMFLVIDEYGGTAGLVSFEDAIETLLGVEIVDELDSVADMRKLAREIWERRKREKGIEH